MGNPKKKSGRVTEKRSPFAPTMDRYHKMRFDIRAWPKPCYDALMEALDG